MNAIQTHFWAVRDYLAPVLRESKFKEHGRITPDEFVAAGDFLAYKFPTWSWSSGDASKTRDFLPKDKQYLVSKGVPCLRRVSQMERAALGTKRKGAASSSTAQTDERLLSFAEGKDGIDVTGAGGEDDWLATHLDDEGQGASNAEVGEIEDMPDAPPEADSLTAGQEDDLASRIAGTSLGDDDDDRDDGGEVGDIPDMDDEDEEAMAGAGVVEHEDPSALAPPPKAAPTTSAGGSNILSVRTYDCLISYDKYYQTPRMWLVGYDEHGSPLKPAQIFEDISSDYAQKTVTIEPFPHSATLNTASVHPCKHASVMRKVIERMDASVKEEQKRLRTKQQQGGEGEEASVDDAAAPTSSTKKKKWGLGGAMKKVANRSTSSAAVATSDSSDSPGDATTSLVEVEGLRVDQYLLVFLKFMASIVPAIEIDATQSF